MAVNANRPERWKADIAQSVDFYNNWFLAFAPKTFRETRIETTKQVEKALTWTSNLTNISPALLQEQPSVLPILRMATAPPLARDRLIGLAGVSKNLVEKMERENRLPPRMSAERLVVELDQIGNVILQLADEDVFPWLKPEKSPTDEDVYRAATIVADRLCGAVSDPIIRNAQKQRQLEAIRDYLADRSYQHISSLPSIIPLNQMEPGTFTFRRNVVAGRDKNVNIPIDTIVQPQRPKPNRLPLLIEAKSAGDFTNTNKRRKEEATKMRQLQDASGNNITFILFLNGYFDSGYQGYEAAEGIDWVWEHRIEDLAEFGI